MHDIKWIRDNPQAFDRALARRGLAGEAARLIAIDERRRATILKAEQALARRNAASKEIGAARKAKDEERATALMAEVAELKAAIPALEAQERAASRELDAALSQIPNLPLDDVPDGADEHDNVEHHRFGTKRDYPFTHAPRHHFELGEALGQMDFETAAKLSGSRFVVLKRSLARLERALGQFMLDLHTSAHGYTEIAPPLMVRDEVMFGTAQLPKFAFDQFAVTRLLTDAEWDDRVKEAEAAAPGVAARDLVRSMLDRQDRYWLVPTAEVPLTNLVREEILDEAELPLRLTALTPCFRAEAGA
ncbi:MAG: serine--tRNA ligase, partial [Bradyrhizobiaceae bacterium]|nr:serine--tRNA ligase [Bradyrhizobiaceae bacterium]